MEITKDTTIIIRYNCFHDTEVKLLLLYQQKRPVATFKCHDSHTENISYFTQ